MDVPAVLRGDPAVSGRRGPLRVRWLGRVRYGEALTLQRALARPGGGEHLLLLEHPHVYTLGVRARAEHVLVDPASVGAELARADRGGDVTYHGPGQLVGYPILDVPPGHRSVPAFVSSIEDVIVDALADLGLPGAGRLAGFPGVWMDLDGPRPAKICAVGVRVTRGRSMHGFALNVHPDLSMFAHIVPCGITDKAVTSLAARGVGATMAEVVDAVAARAVARWAGVAGSERQDVAGAMPARRAPEAVPAEPDPVGAPVSLRPARRPLHRRLAAAGVDPDGGVPLAEPKPPWLRARARMGPEYRSLQRTMRRLSLVTVCEEAGCPNIYECWADGTATFMINGERCTRACGFCLVDTRHPLPADPSEPERVAEAVSRLGLAHAVVTAVARDDLADGGAGAFAATVSAIRAVCPTTAVELLVPDCKGDPQALDAVFAARPDVLNHNLETVARLQRAVRPSASYARSLALLARAREAGLLTKSGLVLGMGETEAEVIGALADLRGVGVEVVTVGQYLRPTAAHVPVARWWTPEDFGRLRRAGEEMGFAHVQASPLTRSSYHARKAAVAAATSTGAAQAAATSTGAAVAAATSAGAAQAAATSTGAAQAAAPAS